MIWLAVALFGISTYAAEPPISEIIIPGEEWQLLGEGYKYTEGPSVDAEGNVYFTDIPNNRIHKISLDGKISVFVENTGGANGSMFGPDGKIYVCQNGKKRIAAFDVTGQETVITEEVGSNDIVVNHKGEIYFTDPPTKQIYFINAKHEKRVVDTGITFPNGVRMTPDQGTLLVADSRTSNVWAFRIEPDGSLAFKQPYFTLYVPDGRKDSGADGMTVDTLGRLYVATHLGVQVLDQAGRVIGMLSKPQSKKLSNLVFGGPEFNYLYATSTDKVYRRKTKAKGVLFFQAPILPPKPHL